MRRMYQKEQVILTKATPPVQMFPNKLIEVDPKAYHDRISRFRKLMSESGLDCCVLYADREHFANFHYFAGFEPRFEEGLLVIHQSDPSYILLGNECICMSKLVAFPTEGILCPVLSLPSQPMDENERLEESLHKAGLKDGMHVGIIGWKLLRGVFEKSYCVPHFVVEAIKACVGDESLLTNATPLLINPNKGLRCINNVDQIAFYEFGSTLASENVRAVIDHVQPGVTEMELAGHMNAYGLPMSCHPMVSAGDRTDLGLVSPSSNQVRLNDPLSTGSGLRGGLSCRGGYVSKDLEGAPAYVGEFVEDIAKPYFGAVASWYENIGIGVTGGELYDCVQTLIPKEKFGWVLNPGHLIADEEWLSSPIYPQSKECFVSGQLIQMDIIPSLKGFVSPNAEDGVLIADKDLQDEIRAKYPDMWQRMQMRRDYMKNELGIELKPEVFPMSNIAGYYRPLMLAYDLAFKLNK